MLTSDPGSAGDPPCDPERDEAARKRKKAIYVTDVPMLSDLKQF